jgi:hypothetical protein
LPQVRCPQCGAFNVTSAPDYPFCTGCQDNLAKCGYCRWFDSGLGICTSPEVAGLFDAAPDATPPCDQHTPRETLLLPHRSIWPIAIVGSLALMVLLYSLFQARQPSSIPPTATPEGVRLAVVCDPKAYVGRPFFATAELSNGTPRVVTSVWLQISRRSGESFRLVSTVPRYDAKEETGEWMAYIYRDLQPGETRRVVMEFVPRHPGSRSLDVRLASRGGLEYYGLSQALIRVNPAPG